MSSNQGKKWATIPRGMLGARRSRKLFSG